MIDAEASATFRELWAEHIALSEDFAWSDFEAAYEACESPIERRLLPHLLFLRPGTMGHRYGGTMDTPIECRLLVQPVVSNYRPDFVLMTRAAFQPGADLNIAIECDGHAFHDATKEAAARDKDKTNALQIAGYSVLRFSGSQIHESPMWCARKVSDLIDAHYTRKLVSDVAHALTSEERWGK